MAQKLQLPRPPDMDVVPGAGDGSGDVRVDGHLHTQQLAEYNIVQLIELSMGHLDEALTRAVSLLRELSQSRYYAIVKFREDPLPALVSEHRPADRS